MITFKFDKKTGRFEYKLVAFLNKEDLDCLKAVMEQKWLDHETFAVAFPVRRDADENSIYQEFTNLTYKLNAIGFIEWKNDARVLVKVDKADYKNNVYETHSGYFLTEMGEAFLNSL